VTNLSLELATTKAALDELQLEHRRVINEKERLKSKISELKEANNSLHRMIDKLEKEKLLMTMEQTVGVARSAEGPRFSFVSSEINNQDGFKLSTFRAEPRGGVKKKSSRRHRSRSGDDGQFRGSINTDAGNTSVASGDPSSIISCLSHEDLEELAKSLQDGALLPTKNSSDALDKLPKQNDDDPKKNSSKSPLAEAVYDESDPFATWLAPEDRAKQQNNQKNWFQRRVESLGVQQNQQKDDNQDGDDDSDQLSGDPFDTCSKGDHNIEQIFDDNKSDPPRQEQRGGGFQWFRGNRGQK
jgi:hypothetical protein